MRRRSRPLQHGFSLIELIIVMALLVIIAAAILLQVRTAQQRAAFERTQIDMFQEAREFMDQISRDVRQVGYPNPRNFDAVRLPASATAVNTTTTPSTPIPSSSPVAAVGLVYVGDYDLWFQGGIDDSGNVLYTQYHYDSSTTGGCPCLKRSQQVRSGTPGSETANYTSEVQNVVVTTGVPIFSYFANGGTVNIKDLPVSPAVSLPLQWDNSFGATNANLASIDTVVFQLTVQSPYRDLKTNLAPTTTLYSTIKINNCSQATTGQLSCAN